jgi:CheY-like chemotaxis protein
MQVVRVAEMTTKTILVINREPRLREVVQECLSNLGGWQVFSTGSPLEGLRCADQDQPDAIVLDLSSSGMDYVTFLRKLRAQPTTQTVPVVILATGTKWLNFQHLQPFQVLGVIDYSSDPTEIPQQIAKLLNWHEKSAFLESEEYSSPADSVNSLMH